MPYIRQEDRKALNHREAATTGELNYMISRLCDDFVLLNRGGLSYAALNEVIGVLACVQQELYRRVVVPYEDMKMQNNGDVFNAVDEVEAIRQLVNPPDEPIAVKPEGVFRHQYDNFALTPEHEAYHIDFDRDDEGNAVGLLSPNKDCPFCRSTIGAKLGFRDAVAKEKEHGQTKPRRGY